MYDVRFDHSFFQYNKKVVRGRVSFSPPAVDRSSLLHLFPGSSFLSLPNHTRKQYHKFRSSLNPTQYIHYIPYPVDPPRTINNTTTTTNTMKQGQAYPSSSLSTSTNTSNNNDNNNNNNQDMSLSSSYDMMPQQSLFAFQRDHQLLQGSSVASSSSSFSSGLFSAPRASSLGRQELCAIIDEAFAIIGDDPFGDDEDDASFRTTSTTASSTAGRPLQ